MESFKEFLNEGYSYSDKKALIEDLTKDLKNASLSGNLKKIIGVNAINNEIIEIEMEFEVIQLKIVKITEN